MTLGKTGWANFAFIQRFGRTARQRGFRGKLVSAYSWDRALYAYLSTRVRAWHQQINERLGRSDGEKFWLELTNLVITIPCGFRDFDRSVFWGAIAFMGALRPLSRRTFVWKVSGIVSIW